MSLYVISWNMQGWNDGAKMDAMTDFFDSMNIDLSSNEVVIFLQECGHPNLCGFVEDQPLSYNNDLICQKFCVDPTSNEDNQRCSTAILTSSNVNVSDKGEIFTEVNRGMLYIVYNNRVFSTIHAPANESDSVPFIKELLVNLENGRNNSEYQDWILMGDFNSEPDRYPISDASGRPVLQPETANFINFYGDERLPYFCDVAYPTSETQGSDGDRENIYDFAFMNSQGSFSQFTVDNNNLAFFNNKMSDSENRYLSDHNLIGLEF